MSAPAAHPPEPLDPALLAPLDPEQALHLLDGLTWLPAAGPDRWRRIADHLAARLPDRPAPAPRDCRDAARALAAALGGPTGEGGQPGGAGALYRAKYDLIALLHPDPWFTFLNMGHCTAGPDGPDPCADPELPGTGRHGGALYDLTAAPAPLEGAAVLDVGCGRGGGTARLARTRRPRTVTGLDASPRNVAFCQRDHTAPGLDFRYGEADRLPHPDASFDAVVSVESVHCFPDAGRFLAEAARVLRPGGHLLLADEWLGRRRARPGPRRRRGRAVRRGGGGHHRRGAPLAGPPARGGRPAARHPGGGTPCRLRPLLRRPGRPRLGGPVPLRALRLPAAARPPGGLSR
ncbi:class I SAM-dependent methyltransferase [Kitasatospora arboriphila]